MEDLKEHLRYEMRQITPNVVEKVQQEFISRLGHCHAVNDQNLENLL